MDAALLAQTLLIFLGPALPYLTRLGGRAAEEAAKKAGPEAWESAKKLWARLRPRLDERPAALEAARDVARAPGDADAEGALRLQLRKILEADPDLAADLERLLAEAGATGHRATVRDGAVAQGPGAVAAGRRGIAVGGNVTGSVLQTGDRPRRREEREKDKPPDTGRGLPGDDDTPPPSGPSTRDPEGGTGGPDR